MKRRILAILLALCMTFSLMSVTAFASEAEPGGSTETEETKSEVSQNSVDPGEGQGSKKCEEHDWEDNENDPHTRTCSECGATETTGHEWSGWIMENGKTHAHVCLVCYEVERAKHVYNDGKCACGMTEFVLADNEKFKVEIFSRLNDNETITKVTGTVYDSYVAKLVVPNAPVNPGNATITVGMQKVASMGIDAPRSHSITLDTGVEHADVDVFKYLGSLQNFADATINATITGSNGNDKTVTYALTRVTGENGETIITGTPSTGVSEAWQLLASHLAVNTQGNDSYIVIGNGSMLQIGKEVLEFDEKYSGDLRLDNITNAEKVQDVIDEILEAVTLDTEEKTPELKFVLTKGTTLAVSSSAAKLKHDVTVTVTGGETFKEELGKMETLSVLQKDANEKKSVKDIIIDLVVQLDKAVALVSGETINVAIEFDEHDWNWAADKSGSTHTRTCSVCGETETDDHHYANGKCEECGAAQPSVPSTPSTPSSSSSSTTAHRHYDRDNDHKCDVDGTTMTDHVDESADHICDICGETVTDHVDEDADGICDICGEPMDGDDIIIDDEDVPLAGRPFVFADVVEKDWFYNDVKVAYEMNLMDGASETVFDPHSPTTRGMVAQVLYNMEGKPSIDEYDVTIPDLKSDDWYHDAAIWAYATGVYAGYADGAFHGDDEVTREQLMLVLYRYAQKKGYNVDAVDDLAAFADKNRTSDWALEGVQWAVGAELIRGRGGNQIAPDANTIRAELATILVRFAGAYTDIV